MKQIYDNIKPFLALIVVVLSYTYFFAVLILEGKGNDQVLIAIVGTLGLATGYYWGSSQGMSKANEVIAEASKSNGTTQNVEEINAETLNVKKKP